MRNMKPKGWQLRTLWYIKKEYIKIIKKIMVEKRWWIDWAIRVGKLLEEGSRWKRYGGPTGSRTDSSRQHATSVNLGFVVAPLLWSLSSPWAPCLVRAVVPTLSPSFVLFYISFLFLFFKKKFVNIFFINLFCFWVNRKFPSLSVCHVQRTSLYPFAIKLSPTTAILSTCHLIWNHVICEFILLQLYFSWDFR